MPDGLTDWRSWTNQQEIETATAFPGMGNITDAEIISNNSPTTLAVTGCTNSGTTVTVTVGATTYSAESGETETLIVGQTVTVAGITGFTTNNPNGTWTLTAVTATTLAFVVTNAPTGSYGSGGTVQPNEVFTLGVLGLVSVPTYSNTPATVNAVDPFGGWTSQQELVPSSFGSTFPVAITGVSWSGGVATITVGSTAAFRASTLDPQYVTFSGLVGSTGLNGNTYAVASVPSSTTFTVAASNPGAYTSGGSVTEAQSARPQVTGLTSDATN